MTTFDIGNIPKLQASDLFRPWQVENQVNPGSNKIGLYRFPETILLFELIAPDNE